MLARKCRPSATSIPMVFFFIIHSWYLYLFFDTQSFRHHFVCDHEKMKYRKKTTFPIIFIENNAKSHSSYTLHLRIWKTSRPNLNIHLVFYGIKGGNSRRKWCVKSFISRSLGVLKPVIRAHILGWFDTRRGARMLITHRYSGGVPAK